jgi:hypothetical protein
MGFFSLVLEFSADVLSFVCHDVAIPIGHHLGDFFLLFVRQPEPKHAIYAVYRFLCPFLGVVVTARFEFSTMIHAAYCELCSGIGQEQPNMCPAVFTVRVQGHGGVEFGVGSLAELTDAPVRAVFVPAVCAMPARVVAPNRNYPKPVDAQEPCQGAFDGGVRERLKDEC